MSGSRRDPVDELELAEIFAVQDAIAERVAGAIEPELLKNESLPGPCHNGNVSLSRVSMCLPVSCAAVSGLRLKGVL